MAIITDGPVTTVPSGYPDKNNVIGGGGGVGARTIEAIINPFCAFSFSVKYNGTTPTDLDGHGSDFLAVVSLRTTESFDAPYDFDFPTSPISLIWKSGTSSGTIKEEFCNYSSSNVVATRDNVDPGSDVIGAGTNGPRYTFLLSGSEFRVYSNYSPNSGQSPIVIVPAPLGGFPFPLRLNMVINQAYLSIENVVASGNLRPTTIYSLAQQEEDFGVEQSELFLRIYPKARYEGVGNPVDV
jgi:hypothetical protein